MQRFRESGLTGLLVFLATMATAIPLSAQNPAVLTADELARIVPPSFYFEGQLGPTQMRNAAGLRLAANRHFIAALVDTSGYATSVRSKYEGLLICDDAVTIGGTELKSGAYGFGGADGQKFNVFDVGGKLLFSVAVTKDDKLQSPRPLLITRSGNELRLYRGRSYVVVAPK